MKPFKLPLIIAGIIIAVFVMAMFIINNAPNRAIGLEEQITNARSEIQIQEKRRSDLIPNLVECVKEYDKHEYDTLVGLVDARGVSTMEVSSEIQTLVEAVAEQYPELKSSENYQQLMSELSLTENKIANVRSDYNRCVTEYNTYCKRFPNRTFLIIAGYTPEEYNKLDFDAPVDAPTNLFGD